MTKFKQLSFWAKQHKWSSRFIIVFSFLIMNALAIITGSLFNDLNINFPVWFLVLSILAFSFAWLKYPNEDQDRGRTYVLRKTCDSILIGSTFLMLTFFGNHRLNPFDNSILFASTVNSYSLPKDSTKAYKSVEDFKKSLYDESGKPLKWKERKKLLKEQVKAIKKDKTISDGGKVGLIILCVLLALILAYGVAALACSLSCAGSDAAAVIVAVLGLGGIVLLTIFLIRSIIRKSKKEKAKEVKEEKPLMSN